MTTLNLVVATGNDDADQNAGGTIDRTNTTLTATAGGHWLGFRFTGVTIPSGATISAATLKFTVISTANDDVFMDFYFNKVADAAAISTTSNDIGGRTLTTAKTTLSVAGVGSGVYSVNVLSALQEVYTAHGPFSNVALMVVGDANGGSCNMLLRSCDFSSGSAAPALDITYTVAATGNPYYYYRQQ